MKQGKLVLVVVFMLTLLYAAIPAAWGTPVERDSRLAATLPDVPGTLRAATSEEKQNTLQAFDLSPAVFVENKGQWDSEVRYGFDGRATRVSFTDAGPVFQMLRRDGEGDQVHRTVFSATFVGAGKVKPTGLEESSGKTNYYIGKDPSKWQSNVPSFQKVAYRGIYDGVDLYAWGRRSGLKYEFHVTPGASWEQIVIRYDGIEGLSLDEKGALHVKTSLGEIVDSAPVVYQDIAGGRVEIAARYRLVDKNSYAFEITGHVDPSLPLVIDPELAWASYLGGGEGETGYGIAADASGNCYVIGSTTSTDFPTPGGFDTSYNGGYSDAFLAKVTASGQLVWASYLGGSEDDMGCGIAADASGNCYVTGYTASADFPTPGGFDTSYNGEFDAFVAAVTSSGQLAWASYLGGNQADYGNAIAVDAWGNCYVAGWTISTDFPTPGGFDTTLDGFIDAFVAKVTSSGNLAWASHLGGNAEDYGNGIAVDASGNCYVTGYTDSSDFPTAGGFGTSWNGSYDAFVAKLTSSGNLAWASYLGGSDGDVGLGIAADASGNCCVTGWTNSSGFATPGGFDTSYNGGYSDAFLAKVTASGQLAWASYLGGASDDYGYGIAADASGNYYVTGYTPSSDFPTPRGFDTTYNAEIATAFLAKVTPSGQLAWASYLGGSGSCDVGCGIAVDGSGNCYVTGSTSSSDFPTHGGFDTSYGGNWDAFVAKIPPPRLLWLEIGKFQMTLPEQAGKDVFLLSGLLNMPITANVPETVTLSIDGWSVVMDASSWKRVGKSNVYTCKQGNVVAKMTYWVKGTTKCLFAFTASKQTLQGSIPHFPSVPVRLQVGGDFDETVVAGMTLKNHVARLSSVGPLPLFYTEHLTVTRNLRLADHDAFALSGKVFLDGDFDPALDSVTMRVGPHRILLPAGTIGPAKNGIVKYTAPTAHGKMVFQVNNKTGALKVTATGVDMSAVTQDIEVSLSITNHSGADWYYGLLMARNSAGTVYKY